MRSVRGARLALEQLRSARVGQALDVFEILDAKGQALERPRGAVVPALLGGLCLRQQLIVGTTDHQRVEVGVGRGDTLDRCLHQFDSRELALAKKREELAHGTTQKLGRHARDLR